MASKVCTQHRRRDCSTCKTASRAAGDSTFTDAAMWTTVYGSDYGSSYDSGSSSSYDSGSSSSCGSSSSD